MNLQMLTFISMISFGGEKKINFQQERVDYVAISLEKERKK
jgi:hypothetical protein